MGRPKDWPPLNCKRNSLWITFRKLMFFLKIWGFSMRSFQKSNSFFKILSSFKLIFMLLTKMLTKINKNQQKSTKKIKKFIQNLISKWAGISNSVFFCFLSRASFYHKCDLVRSLIRDPLRDAFRYWMTALFDSSTTILSQMYEILSQ